MKLSSVFSLLFTVIGLILGLLVFLSWLLSWGNLVTICLAITLIFVSIIDVILFVVK
jgi:hypothetical protein